MLRLSCPNFSRDMVFSPVLSVSMLLSRLYIWFKYQKRRKLPNDSDMLCIEVIWDRSHLIILCRMTQIILKFFVTSQIWNETNYGHRKYWSRNGIEPNELYDKFGHRIIIWVWHHFHSSKWMANDQIRKLFLG